MEREHELTAKALNRAMYSKPGVEDDAAVSGLSVVAENLYTTVHMPHGFSLEIIDPGTRGYCEVRMYRTDSGKFVAGFDLDDKSRCELVSALALARGGKP